MIITFDRQQQQHFWEDFLRRIAQKHDAQPQQEQPPRRDVGMVFCERHGAQVFSVGETMVSKQYNRVGVVALTVENRKEHAAAVNSIISDFGELVVGRMGVPYRERGLSVISLLVDGTTDALGVMTGKLGSIPGVRVRSVLLTPEGQMPPATEE